MRGAGIPPSHWRHVQSLTAPRGLVRRPPGGKTQAVRPVTWVPPSGGGLAGHLQRFEHSCCARGGS